MYTKYFGFKEKPFTLTPNPRFIFLSKHHKEAFAHLLYGINSHYGFIELIGEVGTGKTTVLRTLLGQLQDKNYRTALIFNPSLTGVELLRSINNEFGIDASSPYANELLAVLNRFLLEENTNGRTVVLVIDEAQNLDPATLEQIRLISNLETEDDKLIQIILAGQPELEHLLSKPELRQINQRIAVRYRLSPISMDETRAYIRHRMEVAGESGGVSFSRYAIKYIYLYTRGVPRMINILCDRALLIAYGDERRDISAGIISRAIREILNLPRNRFAPRHMATMIAAVIIVMFLALWAAQWQSGRLLHVGQSLLARSPAPATTEPPDAKPPAKAGGSSVKTPPLSASAARRISSVEQELLSYDQVSTHLHALNALIGRWRGQSYGAVGVRLTTPDTFSRLAAKRGLRLTPFKGTLDEAIRFGLPFLAVTRVSGELGPYCLAVTAVRGDGVTVSPALFGKGTIEKKELASLVNGTFYLVWKNIGRVPVTITPGEHRNEIGTLQRLLKQAGPYHGPFDGIYGDATAAAVREFQHSHGIAVDDLVGELTLAALVSYDKNANIPSLKGN
ncbi:AAA family ATPase [Oryzomonas japonica]|uniref:AAA family ATPase n=1 Tax=Oryzomonas japonica TaxID=2603858 RepID=A0A7J4ZTP5_9BACT|nr:ExeA family protein [Oryzomonas japonica]KAB0666792.1 AAA family ATPase [Oryzomonas japonica]